MLLSHKKSAGSCDATTQLTDHPQNTTKPRDAADLLA